MLAWSSKLDWSIRWTILRFNS